MCDYSLEQYHSRPAQQGEDLETHRFPSGTVGFISSKAKSDKSASPVAVCMACDMELQLDGIPESAQKSCGVGKREQVTFCRIEGGPHQDGVRFKNGTEIILQRLGPDVRAVVVDDLSDAPGESSDEDEIVRSERELEPA